MIEREYATYLVTFNNRISSDLTNLPDGIYKFSIIVNGVSSDIILNCIGIVTFNDLARLLDYHMRRYGIKVWLVDNGLHFSGLKPATQTINVPEYLVGDADWLWANISGYVPVGV
jgi:hypothetical protein